MRAQRMNKNISIWSRGVDRDQFNPGRRSLEWRRAHGIGDDEMVVAFLGRLVLEKGLDVFADAVDAAKEKQVPLKILIIGDGPARDYFIQRLPDAVFTGQLTGEELSMALASADVFLNPSITETFGNVTLEAMASGLPVLAAAASGTTSLVQHGVTGQLSEPGDIDAFADELQLYQRDPALRAKHGAAGLEAAKRMDWDEINAEVMHVYERVIERRHRLNRRLAVRALRP
jgi:phosphatidylinositol alpha 1,6-mannosyltransferase